LENQPRCEFRPLLQRLKTILQWIQLKKHLTELKSLAYHSLIRKISKTGDDEIHKLEIELKQLENHFLSSQSPHSQRKKGQSAKHTTGCCWSEFLLLFVLFCTEMSMHIPGVVFGVYSERYTNFLVSIGENEVKIDKIISLILAQHQLAESEMKLRKKRGYRRQSQDASPFFLTSTEHQSQNIDESPPISSSSRPTTSQSKLKYAPKESIIVSGDDLASTIMESSSRKTSPTRLLSTTRKATIETVSQTLLTPMTPAKKKMLR
jgi:hypothetical protein